MDFLKKFVGSQGDSKEGDQSNSEILADAKVVAEAAQSAYSHNTDSIDKAKVADAAGDLLEAGSKYGKLEDTGYGEYVKKAEDYLHNYGSDQPAKDPAPAAPEAQPAPADKGAEAPPADSGSGDAKPEGGIGDYAKIAQGFLNKN